MLNGPCGGVNSKVQDPSRHDEAGDPAGAAKDQAFEREVIDTGQQLIAVADGADGFVDAAGVACRFLDGDEFGFVGEFAEESAQGTVRS